MWRVCDVIWQHGRREKRDLGYYVIVGVGLPINPRQKWTEARLNIKEVPRICGTMTVDNKVYYSAFYLFVLIVKENIAQRTFSRSKLCTRHTPSV